MIKPYFGAPALFVMTLFAILTLLTFMGIIKSVAVITIFFRFMFKGIFFVAGSTGRFCMFTAELKFGLFVVVESMF